MAMNHAKFVRWLCVLAGASVLAACGTLPGPAKNTDPAAIVGERVEARWKALIEGRLDAAYEYLSPGSRAAIPISVYRTRVKPGMWREVKVKSVACGEELCKASVWLKYDVNQIKGLELDFEESWVKENGNWWYVQRK